MRNGAGRRKYLKLPGRGRLALPLVWLGQSVRTTVVTDRYPIFSRECWMVSLGDAVHRPRLVEKVFRGDLRERIGVHGPLMLDSGGFTMMMNNQSLAIETIAEIYRVTQAELCITLDLPPTEADSRRIRSRKYREARDNLAHLVEAVGAHRIVPVVHGTTVGEVENNCSDIAGLIAEPRLICLGGLVPLLRRSGQPVERDRSISWLSGLIASVRTQFPDSVIHVLGAGSPQNITTVITCGADSTDSLAWRRAAGFGTIYLPGTSERFVAPRNRARANSRPTLADRELELLEACLCPACGEFPKLVARLEELQKSYLARAAHNAFVILAEAKRVPSLN